MDFEFKTREGEKSWGDRNIKLVFSRKLLYFGGVLAAAETFGLPLEDKRQRLKELLLSPPIERVRAVCGAETGAALDLYEFFLARISKPDVREQLKAVTPEDRQSHKVYRELKDKGREFSDALRILLRGRYPDEHPIHMALLF